MASPTASESPAIESFILESPLILPPAGETANLINPPNKIVTCLIILVLTMASAAFFVTMRLYVSLVIDRRFRLEDCEFDVFPVLADGSR